MLEMRPDCEACGKDLPAQEPGAMICSFECTYCASCAATSDRQCPTCGGELVSRPAREAKWHAKHPPSAIRKFKQ